MIHLRQVGLVGELGLAQLCLETRDLLVPLLRLSVVTRFKVRLSRLQALGEPVSLLLQAGICVLLLRFVELPQALKRLLRPQLLLLQVSLSLRLQRLVIRFELG